MGDTYLASGSNGTDVALKVINPGLVQDPRYRQRFLREARNAKKVNSAFTARVLDVGDDPVHGPYLVTRYVSGPTLFDRIGHDGPMDVAVATRFIDNVVSGLEAIHGAGVIHRDVTPKNVVISPDLGPVVIDFGISVATDSTTITRPGDVVGTLRYMAPEALHGRPVTRLADIYSLGALAVFATTGLPPYPDAENRDQLLSRLGGGPDLSAVPPPLRGILHRMLSVDPAARPSLEEISRALTSPPPASSHDPATTREQGRPSNRSFLAGLVVLLLMAGIAFVGTKVLGSDHKADTASKRVAAEARRLLAADRTTARQLALAAYAASPTSEAYASLIAAFGVLPPTTYRKTTGDDSTASNTNAVDIASDGRWLAAATQDNGVNMWDTGQDPTTPPVAVPHTDEILDVEFSPDRRTLAVARSDGKVGLWDVSQPTEPHPRALGPMYGDRAVSVDFRPDGKALAIGASDGKLRIWDISNPDGPVMQAEAVASDSGDVYDATFSPDGRMVATAGKDHTVRLWDASAAALGELVQAGLDRPPSTVGEPPVVRRVEFSPDGALLAAAVRGDSAYLYDLTGPQRLTRQGRMPGHQSYVTDVAFSAHGTILATGDDAGTIRLWDVSDRAAPTLLATQQDDAEGDRSWINAVAFSPTGDRLATAVGTGQIYLWPVSAAAIVARACADPANNVAQQLWEQHLPELDYRSPCG